MADLDFFQSGEEYIKEALDWVMDWIRLYRRYAVFLDEQGQLKQIKGSITFGDDLELSLEGRMTQEEKEGYEKEAEVLRKWMRTAQKKAGNSFRQGIGIPLEYLFQIWNFSEPARFCILMALSAEYDRTMGRMFSLLQDDYKEKYPTLDLCLKLYTPYEEKRFRYQAELMDRDSGFQELLHTPLDNTAGQIRLHPRILRFLEQFEAEDSELLGIAQLKFFHGETDEEKGQNLERAAWRKGTKNVCFIYGPSGAGKRTLAGKAAARRRHPVLYIDVKALYYKKGGGEALLRNIGRELIIRTAVPCLVHGEALIPKEDDSEEVKKQKEGLMGKILNTCLKKSPCLFITSEKKWEGSWNWTETARTDWEIPFPSVSEQIGLWERMLKELSRTGMETGELSPEALSVRFSLTPGQMAEALKEASDQCAAEGKSSLLKTSLYQACRRQLVMNLGEHVTRIQTQYQWDDLVLPRKQKEALKSACNQVEFSHQVYDLWGFERKIAYGKGVSMLFYGPPGTGKTMGAQVIANQLSMELYKVDLSSVMSKYIGETEKNLGKIFDEVKKSRSILFFDEADALFGKRTEVKDSHDKYANAETAYLLQKIEEYQGVVILATNYMQNFDEAFKRRIKFIIEFPFPLAPCRLEMWRKVFPENTPLEELDYDYLAEQFELSGSSIKNIAVAAAFLAAPLKEPVGMRQVLTALKNEMMKAGKSMPPESFGEYYGLIKDCF